MLVASDSEEDQIPQGTSKQMLFKAGNCVHASFHALGALFTVRSVGQLRLRIWSARVSESVASTVWEMRISQSQHLLSQEAAAKAINTCDKFSCAITHTLSGTRMLDSAGVSGTCPACPATYKGVKTEYSYNKCTWGLGCLGHRCGVAQMPALRQHNMHAWPDALRYLGAVPLPQTRRNYRILNMQSKRHPHSSQAFSSQYLDPKGI